MTSSASSPFDVVRVPGVVALHLIVDVIQHHHPGHDVDHLAGGQQVEVVTTVLAAVTVTGRRRSRKIAHIAVDGVVFWVEECERNGFRSLIERVTL